MRAEWLHPQTTTETARGKEQTNVGTDNGKEAEAEAYSEIAAEEDDDDAEEDNKEEEEVEASGEVAGE